MFSLPVENKLNPRRKDEVHGNDVIANDAFNHNAEHYHHDFRIS